MATFISDRALRVRPIQGRVDRRASDKAWSDTLDRTHTLLLSATSRLPSFRRSPQMEHTKLGITSLTEGVPRNHRPSAAKSRCGASSLSLNVCSGFDNVLISVHVVASLCTSACSATNPTPCRHGPPRIPKLGGRVDEAYGCLAGVDDGDPSRATDTAFRRNLDQSGGHSLGLARVVRKSRRERSLSRDVGNAD